MKKVLVINLSLLALGCMLMGAFKLTDISSSVLVAAPFAGGLIPPATEFSEMQYPGPIVEPDVNLKPQELGKHDFRLALDDKPVYGPSAHDGYVISATDGKMLVKTAKGILTYTYILPGTTIIPAAEKDKVSVRINQGIPDDDQNFVITDSINGKLLHSSARQASEQPVKIQFSPDTRLYQTDEYETIVTERHYLRYISVVFQHGKFTTKIIPNKKNIITIDGEKYSFVVLSSYESHPTPSFAAQSEGEGYYLEYYIAKN